MPTKEELSWLAGFTDADGSISLFRHQQKKREWKTYPALVFTNTNPVQIEKVLSIIDKIGVKVHVVERDQTSKKSNWARSWQITTANHTNVTAILTAIEPYLAGKGPQARLVLRYLKSRADRGRYSRVNDAELALVEECQKLNQRGVSKILTDYTHNILNNWNEDIVGATAKSVE